MKVDKFENCNDWRNWVGKEVVKHPNNPFKSTLKTGVVKDYTTNPHSGKDGFLMDDGSIVDCYQVKLK